MLKVLTIFGTRPEAIKLAPVIAELERHHGRIVNRNCLTGQHRDMVAPLIDMFGIRVDHDLDIMRENQTLEYVTTRVLQDVGGILRQESFDYVLVQGDTTTSMAASLAAFYCNTRVGHVEAGLRTFDNRQPYPEELNRRVIDATADLFFAHTEFARQNLLREGVREDRIAVTGNTVIDALLQTAKRPYTFDHPQLRRIVDDPRKLVLVTAHRRESFGEQFESICRGLRELATKYAREILIAYPVHRNPNVRGVVERMLSDTANVVLLDPQDYLPFVHLMKRSYLIITDSGGIQEEAPSLDKPVLVLRNVTERQEALAAGTIRLVGTDAQSIVAEASRLLDDRDAYVDMASRTNPYGDGTAGRKTVEKLLASAESA